MTRRVFFHTVAWLGYDNQLPFFPLSTPVRGLPFLDIASHPWCQHCSLGARSYEDRTLSLKPAPLLGSREILEVRALLTIDRADLCGLSTAERTGSPVSHTLWSYVPAFWLKGNISGWVCLFSEILFLICRKLEITDMVQVAPTCQLFLAIARPLLYQTIDVSLVS